MTCKLWVCTSPGKWSNAKAVFACTAPSHWAKAESFWTSAAAGHWSLRCSTQIPTISRQPVSMTVAQGDRYQFTIAAANYETIYWEFKTAANGAWVKTWPGLAFSSVSLKRDYVRWYRVVLINNWGTVYSQTVTATVGAAHAVHTTGAKPVIHGRPTNVTVAFGAFFTFHISGVTGAGVTFYWEVYVGGKWVTWGHGGRVSASGKADNRAMNGQMYRVYAYNSAGVTISAAARLTIR